MWHFISIDIIKVTKSRKLNAKMNACRYSLCAHIVSLLLQLIGKEYIKRITPNTSIKKRDIVLFSPVWLERKTYLALLPHVSVSSSNFERRCSYFRDCVRHAIMILDVTYIYAGTNAPLEIKESLTRTAECFWTSKYIPKQIVKNRHIYPPRAWNAK